MPEEANDGDVLDMARQYFGHGNWNAKYWFIGPEPGQAAGENDDLLRRAKAWRDLGGGELNDCREFHDRPVFKQNRHLLHDLPSIGAAVVELWVKETHGVRPLIMVVPHTFGGYLNFNCHLHILVSDGGLNESQGQWLAGLMFDQDALMRLWRDAVLNYLRMALKADVLRSNRSVKFLESVFTSEYARPKWIVYISKSMSKRHFLSYAARYAKRLPVAQRWLSRVREREVEFFAKDTRKHQRVKTTQSSTRFVAALAEHVPDRYRNNIRYYGLLAPASIRKTSAALCALLGKPKQPRPPRLSWRDSLIKYFGVDPLIDSQGQPMHWTGRLGSAPCPHQ